MASQYLHSGEPLPTAPSLTDDAEHNVTELLVFHAKLLDYLRRLTAKLSSSSFSTGQVTAIETLSLKLSVDYDLPNASPTFDTVIWDNVIRQDTPYGYDTSTGIITFLQSGFYLILAEINIEADTTFLTRLRDGDSNDLPYGHGDMNLPTTGVNAQHTQHVPVHMHKDQTLVLQCNSGNNVQFEFSRFSILKLGDFDSTSGGSIDPCDFDIWQLCP